MIVLSIHDGHDAGACLVQDGRILRHTFREGFRPRVLWKEAAHYEGSTESVFSAKEKAEMEERLRGLGYLQ